MKLNIKTILFNQNEIDRMLHRMAYEILEQNSNIDTMIIIGIKTRGIYLAKRLAQIIDSTESKKILVDSLDITFYRDDLTKTGDQPAVRKADIMFDIKDKNVILVDDVLYTGRTVRAGLEALIESARPKRVQLAVLIDRGHRELPIYADYIGRKVPTSKKEIIKVQIKEVDMDENVLVATNSNHCNCDNEL